MDLVGPLPTSSPRSLHSSQIYATTIAMDELPPPNGPHILHNLLPPMTLQAKSKTRRLQGGRGAKGAADAHPQVDKVFTQRHLMQQVEQLPSGAPNRKIDARSGALSPRFSPEQPHPVARKKDLQRSRKLMDAETAPPPAACTSRLSRPTVAGHNRATASHGWPQATTAVHDRPQAAMTVSQPGATSNMPTGEA
jgi:hypothetical protein